MAEGEGQLSAQWTTVHNIKQAWLTSKYSYTLSSYTIPQPLVELSSVALLQVPSRSTERDHSRSDACAVVTKTLSERVQASEHLVSDTTADSKTTAGVEPGAKVRLTDRNERLLLELAAELLPSRRRRWWRCCRNPRLGDFGWCVRADHIVRSMTEGDVGCTSGADLR